MNNKVKTTGLLVGGYLLGRTKKLKLALTVAASVSGSALYRNREQIQEALGKLSESSPDFKNLEEKVTGRLIDQVGAKIQEQTDKINTSLDEAEAKTSEAASEAAEKATPDESADEDEEPAEETAEETESKPQSSQGTRKTAAKGAASGSKKTSSKTQEAKK